MARNDRLADSLSHQLMNGNGLFSGSARIGTSLNKFHCVKAPNISVAKCLEKIYKYTNCSPSCFVVAYVYIDRLLHRHPDSLVVSVECAKTACDKCHGCFQDYGRRVSHAFLSLYISLFLRLFLSIYLTDRFERFNFVLRMP